MSSENERRLYPTPSGTGFLDPLRDKLTDSDILDYVFNILEHEIKMGTGRRITKYQRGRVDVTTWLRDFIEAFRRA